jgi:NAD(P)-binding Rossmann-like domain
MPTSKIPEIPNVPLPTLDRLGASVPTDLDVRKVATEWFSLFSAAASSGDAQAFASLFVHDAFWRDILALTWDFRSFSGLPTIIQFLSDRLGTVHPTAFVLRDDASLALQQPFEDLAWISLMFDFETDVGIASGITRLVPTANGEWKACVVFTNLEDLKKFPERISHLRNDEMTHGMWAEDRKRQNEFITNDGKVQDPVVVIVGGGHCGLALAARLKSYDVPTLVVEKSERIGDSWRNRYDTLCLHSPVCEFSLPPCPRIVITVINRYGSYALPPVCYLSPRMLSN